MFKKLSKITIVINVIAILAILYDVFIISSGGGSLYGTDYLFAIYFLSVVYVICFIHLFYYKNIKDKVILTSLDLLPIFLFGIILTLTQETDTLVIIRDVGFVTLVFYILGGITVFLSNFVVHKLYSKIKKSK